ncbi:MAG: hypothetical protein RL038_99 [Actinomycetota bacterium]
MIKRRLDESTSANRRNIINLLNGRFFIFVLFVVIALGIVGVPLRQFVAQNFQINQLETELADYEDVIKTLRIERERWDDPAYVIAQVRQRMAYVMPDEVGYIVLGSEDVPAAVQYKLGSPIPPEPWFETVFESLETASDTANLKD